MVGLCGTLGRQPHALGPVVDHLRKWESEEQIRYEDSEAHVAGTFHPLLAGDQPAEATSDDTLFVVWGDIYGHFGEDGYVPRPGGMEGSAAYLAELYDENGGSLSFAGDLNGGFLALVYNRSARTVSFVTDRVASRPMYYTSGAEGGITFASNVQSLVKHPTVQAQFDLEYLYEYLLMRRVYGVKTPLEDVEELPPASVTTVDLADMTVEQERYWRPTHDPVDRPFSAFVDEFSDLIETVITEWTQDDLDYGVLLSGGSDSRLVLGALDQDPTAFHIDDWMNREAETAREVADVSGTEFRFLERDDGYQERLLADTPEQSNFSGWFDQAYFDGFDEEIAEEVDVLLSGLYADMLFKGGPLLSPRFPLGPLGSVELPVWKRADDLDEYVTHQTTAAGEPPSYFSPPLDIEAIVRNNVSRTDDGVASHGVEYDSLRDLVLYGEYHPMGADTDANYSRSLMDITPYRTPFLDARVLEFQQSMPISYMLRRNLVGRALSQLAPEIAEVPHSGTGVSVKRPFVVNYIGDYVSGFRRKHLSRDSTPHPHLTHGPWTDREELVRSCSFLLDQFRSREELVRQLPFLDYEGIIDCYDDHIEGANNTAVLYALATLLGMPATESAARSDTVATALPHHLRPGPGTGSPTEVMTDE